jgi:histidine triad (HIT) family protein
VTECIFCRIASGDLPATIVKRTDAFVAFRDLNPQAPTHILVIPTRHIPSLDAADDARLMGELLLVARDIAREEGIAAAGYRLVVNTNADGGQTVYHIHAHLLGGRAFVWPPG